MEERASEVRAGRSLRTAVAAVVTGAVLGACGVSIPEVPDLGPGEYWVIGVGHPRGEWGECFEDEAVAQWLMRLDMPSSGSTATFGRDAERADVDRVLACLRGALSGGEVSVEATTVGPVVKTP